MTVVVRKATPDDIPLLVDMMCEFYAESNYPLDHKWATDSFSALLSNETYGAAWMAFEEHEVVGYIVLTVHFSMEYGGLSGSIEDLFVRPAFRRRGIGQICIEALLTDCQKRGLLAVQVETAPDNTVARSLYRRCGLQLRNDERETYTLRFKG